ncbi:MAG: hypothetical protein GTO00_07175 [Deltaproteobacteria bacterium]|nr:hypothetical protein [Deltaproteobacteria bacterium]
MKRIAPFFLVAGMCLYFSWAPAGFAKNPGIILIQPESDAVLSPGKSLFIGKVCGETRGEVTLTLGNGKRLKADLRDGVFYKEVYLDRGKNRVEISFPGTKPVGVNFLVRNNGGYRYHVADMRCGDCHRQGYSVSRPEDSLCYRCHDKKDDKKFVHGPLGGGACAVCHEPHGSRNAYFLKEDTRVLCISCHDQSSSRTHVLSAKNKKCEKCHNPHSSEEVNFLR